MDENDNGEIESLENILTQHQNDATPQNMIPEENVNHNKSQISFKIQEVQIEDNIQKHSTSKFTK